MTVTGAGAYASSSYLATAYGRTAVASATAATTSSANSDSAASTAQPSSATQVTLSAAAQAKLAQADADSIESLIADTRAAIDALYAKAKVAAPIVDGKQTIDLGDIDRRALYAISTNAGGRFTADEQKVASRELQARFDAELEPRSAVARLTGDWSRVYQTARDYMEAAGPEEKASATYATQLDALQKGQQAALDKPGTVPSVKGDPVADHLTRAADSANDVSVDSMITNTRVALDALYTQAKVAAPIVNGKQTVDLGDIDRRALYAISTNAGGQFTADEQKIASQELQARFDAVLAPRSAVAHLTGDWDRVYQAARDYMDAAGPEEKASPAYIAQLDALQKGQQAALAKPGAVPSIKGDPVADYLTRIAAATAGDGSEDDGIPRDFSDVAKDARTALDRQKEAAADKGKELVFDSARRTGQLVDLSDLDNRALSAISLNEGTQFSKEEIRAAKGELDRRTRATLLTAFQQAGSSSDPSSFSLGLIYTYQTMSTEERQATNWTTDFYDLAVNNYQSTSALISMLQQSSDAGTNYFG